MFDVVIFGFQVSWSSWSKVLDTHRLVDRCEEWRGLLSADANRRYTTRKTKKLVIEWEI